MASIRRMCLASARLLDKPVDVLDGDRHTQISQQNNWSWYEVENYHMSPAFFGTGWAHPKTPWFAGAWKVKENYTYHTKLQSNRESIARRILRGKIPPAPGFGKKAVEARKERERAMAAKAGGGMAAPGKGKKKK
eukprot:TRINITY_DN24232_c0_g1_i1.p2 TRINITY_DN24232_c0_g1~~TRINITY_DN24232_c0_g1_i1.p2  ORF type:complete len:156 (+),score=65.83 TRINITY_DN24232_c0_g1_i1:66-470(+)